MMKREYGTNVQVETTNDLTYEITGLTLDDLYVIKQACYVVSGRAREIARIVGIGASKAENAKVK